MQYHSTELFNDVEESLGWFVLHSNGDIFSSHDSSTQADGAVNSLNRGEQSPPFDIGETCITVDLYDADGNFVGSVDFDEGGSFIPGSYKPGSGSEPSTAKI